MQASRCAAAVILLVAACSSSPTTPTGAPATTQAPNATTPVSGTPAPTSAPVGTTAAPVTADICALLTPADLNAATGQSYTAGTPDSVGQCDWNIAGETVNTGWLVVGAIQAQQLSFIKSAFFQGGVDVTVAGHAAFYNPSQGLGSIWVDLGNGSLFVLSFPKSEDLDPSYQAIAIHLAEIALGRM